MNLSKIAARTVLTAGFAGCVAYIASDILSNPDPKICATAMAITVAALTIFRALNYYVTDGVNNTLEYNINQGICNGTVSTIACLALDTISQSSSSIVGGLIMMNIFLGGVSIITLNRIPVLLDWGVHVNTHVMI